MKKYGFPLILFTLITVNIDNIYKFSSAWLDRADPTKKNLLFTTILDNICGKLSLK